MQNKKLTSLVLSLRKLEAAVKAAEEKLSPEHPAHKRINGYKILIEKQRELLNELLFSKDRLEVKRSLSKLSAYSNFIKRDAQDMADIFKSEEVVEEHQAFLH